MISFFGWLSSFFFFFFFFFFFNLKFNFIVCFFNKIIFLIRAYESIYINYIFYSLTFFSQ